MNRDSGTNHRKELFYLSTRARNGILVLSGILLIQIIILAAYHFLPPAPAENAPEELARFRADIDSFLSSTGNPTVVGHEKDVYINEEAGAEQLALFTFNPNGLPAEDWKRLGFTDKEIRVIKNYEAKGGRFYTKEDVKKMYSISPEAYRRIEPYIEIQPPYPPKGGSEPRPVQEEQFLVVDIGMADTTELKKLRGIGPVKARSIVNYRNKLGGYYSVHQLREAWGIDDSLFEVIKPHIVLQDTGNLHKINLNTAEFAELKNHPYIGHKLARIILNYRREHGSFRSTEEIKKIPLVDEELYTKLAPYLKVE